MKSVPCWDSGDEFEIRPLRWNTGDGFEIRPLRWNTGDGFEIRPLIPSLKFTLHQFIHRFRGDARAGQYELQFPAPVIHKFFIPDPADIDINV